MKSWMIFKFQFVQDRGLEWKPVKAGVASKSLHYIIIILEFFLFNYLEDFSGIQYFIS